MYSYLCALTQSTLDAAGGRLLPSVALQTVVRRPAHRCSVPLRLRASQRRPRYSGGERPRRLSALYPRHVPLLAHPQQGGQAVHVVWGEDGGARRSAGLGAQTRPQPAQTVAELLVCEKLKTDRTYAVQSGAATSPAAHLGFRVDRTIRACDGCDDKFCSAAYRGIWSSNAACTAVFCDN